MNCQGVFIVERFLLVRSGLRSLVDAQDGFEVVGEAAGCDGLPGKVQRAGASIVLLDVHAPGTNGLAILGALQRLEPAPRVLAMSALPAGPLPAQVLAQGAAAFVTKQCEPRELARALNRLAGGRRYVSSGAAQAMVLAGGRKGAGPFSALSARELTILMLVSEGYGRQEISTRLGLSPKTVSTYRARVIKKLGARTDVDLARLSLRHGLVEA